MAATWDQTGVSCYTILTVTYSSGVIQIHLQNNNVSCSQVRLKKKCIICHNSKFISVNIYNATQSLLFVKMNVLGFWIICLTSNLRCQLGLQESEMDIDYKRNYRIGSGCSFSLLCVTGLTSTTVNRQGNGNPFTSKRDHAHIRDTWLTHVVSQIQMFGSTL